MLHRDDYPLQWLERGTFGLEKRLVHVEGEEHGEENLLKNEEGDVEDGERKGDLDVHGEMTHGVERRSRQDKRESENGEDGGGAGLATRTFAGDEETMERLHVEDNGTLIMIAMEGLDKVSRLEKITRNKDDIICASFHNLAEQHAA